MYMQKHASFSWSRWICTFSVFVLASRLLAINRVRSGSFRNLRRHFGVISLVLILLASTLSGSIFDAADGRGCTVSQQFMSGWEGPETVPPT
jgi:phosphatidylserine synthase